MADNETLKTLLEVLTASSCADPKTVEQSTKILVGYKGTPGYTQTLTGVLQLEHLNQKIRLLACICLSNEIVDYWPIMGEYAKLTAEDREYFKQNILDTAMFCRHDRSMIRMIKKMLTVVLDRDFPKLWPDLTDKIFARLNSIKELSELLVYVPFLELIVKKYQLYIEKERHEVEGYINAMFPALEKVIDHCMQSTDPAAEATVHTILKTFHHAIYLDYPEYLLNLDHLTTWMNIVLKILQTQNKSLDQPVGDYHQIAERGKSLYWKCKTVAMKIVEKFMGRYATMSWETKRTAGLTKKFQIDFAPSFLDCAYQLVHEKVRNETFVSPTTAHYCYKVLASGLKQKRTFKLLEGRIEELFVSICLPSLCYTVEDNDLWKDNPTEFIRRWQDYNFVSLNCKNAAIDLLETAADLKFGKPIMQGFFVKIAEILSSSSLQPEFKDGLLFCYCHLIDSISDINEIMNGMERVLREFVAPELESPHGFLRARALMMFARYGAINFTDNNFLDQVCKQIVSKFLDPELPVRVCASMALHGILSQDHVKGLIKQNLVEVVQEYLTLMETIDSDEVVLALDGIIAEFEDDIAPFAGDLVLHLTAAFFKYAGDSQPRSKEDDGDLIETNVAAGRCLDAIKRILTLKIPLALFTQFESYLIPVFDQVFTEDGICFLEDSAELLLTILYNQPIYSDKLWSFYPILNYIVSGFPPQLRNTEYDGPISDQKRDLLERRERGWGQDFVAALGGCFQNYIGKGKMRFLQATDQCDTPFVRLLFKSIDRVMEDDGDEVTAESDRITMTTLYITLMENNQGQIDELLPEILEKNLRRLNEAEQSPKCKYLKLVFIEVIAIAIWYNPRLTLQLLDKFAVVEFFFTAWNSHFAEMTRHHQHERQLVGLASILTLNSSEIPALIRENIGSLVNQMVGLIEQVMKLRLEDHQEPVGQVFDDADKYNIDADDKKDDDDEEVVRDDEEEGDSNADDGLSIAMEDNDFVTTGGAIFYDSPFEMIDAVVFTGQCFEGLKGQDPALFDSIFNVMETAQQQRLEALLKRAHEQHQEALQKKAEVKG